MTKKERGYHHGDLRRALLDAALAIVADEGPSAVTMSAVARRAGVSSGAPYRHFKDRVELLRGLWSRADEVLSRRIEEATASAPDPLEGFRRSGVEYVSFAAEEPALFRVLTQGEYAVPRPASDRVSAETKFSEGLRALLHADDARAPLDPSHPLIQQLAARCLVHGLAHFFVDGQDAQLGLGPEQARRIAEALTRALGPPSLDEAEP
ncbi:MAG: TetR/AcrR family transcriptional regulator [Deltaproteobacteria bacterium]|nr:TetR/AcrR family transcriptional regulator [Deltaproteobacteria bacterium]